ncbi:MAG: rhodanese-like domain-containing protein [Alphaproteobacteria bacterium]|nr:rhodanese-like domain-containing protein [Alphaproteobacteria bacterium]
MAGQAYAGDISPSEAWEMLARESAARLIDVRTRPEWQFVGMPDLSGLGKEVAFLSWQDDPSMVRNETFVGELRATGIGEETPLLFICRSGARSRSAAMAATAAGFRRCYNVAGGFEGGLDPERHRGRAEGWKAARLPWSQE